MGSTAQLFDNATGQFLALGNNPGNSGTLDINGGKISLAALIVGNTGTGDLMIRNAGRLDSNSIYVGLDDLANGEISVDGSLSRMTAFKDLTLGRFGQGKLSVINGARAENANGNLGQYVGRRRGHRHEADS